MNTEQRNKTRTVRLSSYLGNELSYYSEKILYDQLLGTIPETSALLAKSSHTLLFVTIALHLKNELLSVTSSAQLS